MTRTKKTAPQTDEGGDEQDDHIDTTPAESSYPAEDTAVPEPEPLKRYDAGARTLPVRITPEEKTEACSKMAKAIEDLEDCARRKKEASAQFKSEEESLNAQIRKYLRVYRGEFEQKTVEVDGEKDFAEGVVRFYRRDTGELINIRDMTSNERQTALDLEDGVAETNWNQALWEFRGHPLFPTCPLEENYVAEELQFLNSTLGVDVGTLAEFTTADFIRAKDLLDERAAETSEPAETTVDAE